MNFVGQLTIQKYLSLEMQQTIAEGSHGHCQVSLQSPCNKEDTLLKSSNRYEKKKIISPFHYFDKGNMATIGRTDAVAEFGKIRLKGILGWLGWLFVHLVYQVGFKNKVSTLLSWVWSYLTFRAGSRLIQEEMDELSVRS